MEETIAIPKSQYDELCRKAAAYDELARNLSRAGKASSAKLTAEERSARAKKAVEARIRKYGQKRRV